MEKVIKPAEVKEQPVLAELSNSNLELNKIEDTFEIELDSTNE
jgi:hypothetical protein